MVERGKRILIVDDEPVVRGLLVRELERVGYSCVGAENATEALACLHNDESFVLVLSDIRMPGIDGIELLQEIKSLNADIAVILMTAFGDRDSAITAMKLGAYDYIVKPFDMDDVIMSIQRALEKRQLVIENRRYQQELVRRTVLMRGVLERYVPGAIADEILKDPVRYLRLGGERRPVTVLFADIRGFTRFAEENSAETVVRVLNGFFEGLTKVVFRCGGTFDKYLGDSIMAFYGAPVSYEDDVERALQTAIDMQKTFVRLQRRWPSKEVVSLGLGIGLNTGEAIVGNVGSQQIMDYTVIGDAVNVARRLQDLAGKGEIIIGESTFQLVKGRVVVEEAGPQRLRGKREPVRAYMLKRLLF